MGRPPLSRAEELAERSASARELEKTLRIVRCAEATLIAAWPRLLFVCFGIFYDPEPVSDLDLATSPEVPA